MADYKIDDTVDITDVVCPVTFVKAKVALEELDDGQIPSVLEADVEKAIRDRVEDGTGNLYVLVNYTALFSTRNILKKLEGEHK